ncbi:MAG: nucleotidyl transferase AbiEii/AbiGii toxin family protein [Candidatus Blackburnbacteria bacterium]|nr:nucleotidyl transferase AbiEii/AbiGii toxin family protein [Candidatus Blackburnbacteria bacterium]
MFTKAILPNTLRALKLVSKIDIIKKSYLAGGTALALHLGHRISEDLDFFTQQELDEKVLLSELKRLPNFIEEGMAWRTVWGKIDKVKFSIFYYQYPLIKKTTSFENIQILDKEDIAAMKIHAIEDRGTKRDFFDLYCLSKEFSLDEMLKFYDKKYSKLSDNIYYIIRSLSYFTDAEIDADPKMLTSIPWSEVKNFFQKESLKLAKEKLGI